MTSTQPGATDLPKTPADAARLADTTDADGWQLKDFAAGDLFFGSPVWQMRSLASANDLTAGVPASSAVVAGLIAQARARGQREPVLFGLIPFDLGQPASLTVPDRLVEAACPAVRTPSANPVRPAVIDRSPVPEPAEYGRMVERALALFAQGDVKKIVLSRAMDVTLAGPTDRASLMRDLLARNRHGYTFDLPIHEAGAGGARMIGASPELLVRREGDRVVLNPLAGSIPRHADPTVDRTRREELAASEKDLREHRYVISDMAGILAELCDDLQVPAQPSVIGTDALWHLSTLITGRLKKPSMTALDLCLALHPTPAMCGIPTAPAFEQIRQLEPFDRGYFAGLVGWQRASGDGEWALTIRCARYDGDRRFRLYAGAGTVAGSDPASEIHETETKMATFLRGITG